VMFDLEQQMAELQLKYGEKHPVVMQLQDNIKRMRDGLNGRMLANSDAIGPASVKIIEQASVPLGPVGSRGMLMLVAAFFSSIIFGLVLAFVFEYMDQTIKTPKDLENTLRVPFLGGIPRGRTRRDAFAKGVLSRRIPKGYINAFKDLTDQVHLLMTTKPFKTLYIATTDTKDGDSIITAHLGYQLAEHLNRRILIIDANFRNPSIHKLFHLANEKTLVEVLTGQGDLATAIQAINPRLSVLPASHTNLNPVTFLDSPKMRQLVNELKSQYDLILFCCAQLKSYQDGYVLASIIDETIFVVAENKTRRQIASQEIAVLKERKVSILGAVLNNRTFPIPKFVYERI
jgi:capsular exopolysaccharide synthesis family protein